MTPAPSASRREPAPRSLRLVPELRAVHLERLRQQRGSELLYLRTKYDLGDEAVPPEARQVTFARAVIAVVRSSADILELPEPLWLRFLPKNVVLGVCWKASGALRGRRRPLVTYAMENNRIERLVGGRRRVPRPIVGLFAAIVGLLVRVGVDRIAFASNSSSSLYRGLPLVRGVEQRVTPELPAADEPPCSKQARATRRPLTAAFGGVLEARKGVDRLIDAWQLVETRLPTAHLTIVGSGPLEAGLRAWAERSPTTRTVRGGRPRAEVRTLFAESRVVVAPSVPDGRWCEQIGLPIKEALAAGSTVVTSSDTGLAGWLREHGHRVVASEGRRDLFVRRLADALEAGLREPLPVEEVRASLPAVDGRLVSDAWLHSPRGVRRADAPPTVAADDAPTAAADEAPACGELLEALRASDRVVVVNPLGVALEHYTAALRQTLVDSGTGVTVRALIEPSHAGAALAAKTGHRSAGRSAVGRARRVWVRSHLVALARARHEIKRAGGGLVIVTWPVLGYLDLALMRIVLGARVPSRLVVHDPEPLVHAVGYSGWARRLGARFARPRSIVVHSSTALEVVVGQGLGRLVTRVPLPLECRDDSRSVKAGPDRVGADSLAEPPIVRVLGQYKRDRDVELLEAIARRVGCRMTLEIFGRGWPPVAGWAVSADHVEEARFIELIDTSAAVLIPYRRFYQSAVAAQCVERAVPFVGLRASSLADLVEPGSPLLVDVAPPHPVDVAPTQAVDARVEAWVAALDRACTLSRPELVEQAVRQSRAAADAWSDWLDRNFTKVA